jgi:hypothetical protein
MKSTTCHEEITMHKETLIDHLNADLAGELGAIISI